MANKKTKTAKINGQRKKTNIRSTIMEYFSRNTDIPRNLFGKSAESILDPSKGGIGTRLKTASNRFMKTIIPENKRNDSLIPPQTDESLTTIPKTSAISKLAMIPAPATNAGPQFLFFKL